MNNYTFEFRYLTRENVEYDNPFIVRELYDFEKEYAEEAGMAFANETDALAAAKRFFWRKYVEKHSRGWKEDRPNWIVGYDLQKHRLVAQEADFAVDTPYCFDTKETVEAMLADVGEENWAKYVLNLRGVWMWTKVYVS